MSTTNWHFPRALSTTEHQRQSPSASMETEPRAAIAVDPQQSLRQTEALCTPGIWWDRSLNNRTLLGIDFMISILASPDI